MRQTRLTIRIEILPSIDFLEFIDVFANIKLSADVYMFLHVLLD